MPSLEASESNQRTGVLRRRSRRAMRPWRSPAARRRWELEGSVERRSRPRESGVHRTEVTKGESDVAEEDWVGGGIGRVTMSCIERVSRTEMELPAGNASRPDGLTSTDPKLLRLGGPGSMQSQQSWTVDGVDDGLGLDMVREMEAGPLFHFCRSCPDG